MIKKEGLYLVEQGEEYGKSVIYLFSRLKNGQKKIEKSTGARPYFYIPNDDLASGLDVGGEYTSIYGERVKKIFINKARDIRTVKSRFEKHYEADINFANRYLINEISEIENSKYKVFHIDIETLSEGGFPDVNITQQPIVCLTIYDTFTEKYISWIWKSNFDQGVQIIEDGIELRKFSSEVGMLADVIKYFEREQPDIITGWNVVNFDMKYIANRMKKLGLNINKLSPVNSTWVTPDRPGITAGKVFPGEVKIKGIVIFDMFNHYRKIHKGELTSYSLNNVAQEELGEEKMDSHHVVDEDWKTENWMNVIKYNKKDVELTVKLDKKTGLIDFFNEMRILAHANFDDCKYYGRIVDLFILRYAHKNDIILPSKKEYDPNRELEGGFVREPCIGLHDNVIILDLNQLYPSLIQTFNLSPETRDENGEININGIKFTKSKQGLVPSILDELYNIRTGYKNKMKELRYDDPEFKIYDAKQQAAKNLICTVYGVNALSTFRLNTDYVAQTITYLGRELNQWLARKVEAEGHEVIYGDTDSIFVKIKNCNFIEEGKRLSDMLNEQLGEFAKQFGIKEHSLGLDFEKAYKKMLIGAKKRYAAHVCWKDGEDDDAIQIVGFDTKRSDSSRYSRDIQKKLFEMILRNGLKSEILQYIEKIINELEEQDYVDIAIPVKFEKSPDAYKTNIPRVRGAKYAKKVLNVEYRAGDKILMLYIKGENDCLCFEDVDQFDRAGFKPIVDYAKLIDKLILMKVKRLLIAAGWEDDYMNLRAKYIDTWGNRRLNEFIK